jgi:hypothetical protein
MVLNTKKMEEQVFDEPRFEFLLYVNNIICQRGFNIRDYDEKFTDVVESNEVRQPEFDEIKTLIDSLTGMNNGEFWELGMIPNHLKQKSITYLWDNYNPFQYQGVDSYKSPNKKGDTFQFEIKADNYILAKVNFLTNFFTLNPKINVDIREIYQKSSKRLGIIYLQNYSKVGLTTLYIYNNNVLK